MMDEIFTMIVGFDRTRLQRDQRMHHSKKSVELLIQVLKINSLKSAMEMSSCREEN